MSHAEQTTVSGDVTDVFAHRFVVSTAKGRVLADLGLGGAERIKLIRGDRVDLWGEMKLSELKVDRIAKAGGEPVTIGRDKHADGHDEVDPAVAVRTVAANGFAVVGVPRRKPKHFEILGRDKDGDFVEWHVTIDGTLRKSKPVGTGDEKWAQDMERAG